MLTPILYTAFADAPWPWKIATVVVGVAVWQVFTRAPDDADPASEPPAEHDDGGGRAGSD